MRLYSHVKKDGRQSQSVCLCGIMSEFFFTSLDICSVIRIKVTGPTCPVRMLLNLAADLSHQLIEL